MDHSPYKRLKVSNSLEGRASPACPGEGGLGKLCLIIVIVGGNSIAVDLPKLDDMINLQGPRYYRNEYNSTEGLNASPKDIKWPINQDIS